jgi:hypothetical protein
MAAIALAQTPAAAPCAARDSTGTAVASCDSTGGAPRRIRRQPVTPALERSAFADARARTLLQRARTARVAQDSALRGYDAKTYQRISVGMGMRHVGLEKLLLRTESAARVRWSRASGVLVEPTGRRSAFPMGRADLDLVEITPIPYFPGRESLWIPSGEAGVARAEVNENDLLHPLATGAEAYYRYATGDSISIRLPDGHTIALRELRITARRPDWRAFVGSFWFDVDRGSLVRAVYRLSADIDFWQLATEEERRKIAALDSQARADTGEAARRSRDALKRQRKDARWEKVAQATFSPYRASISAITVEYGLYDERFWLPQRNVAEGDVQATFLRMPIKIEESFRYNTVNGSDTLVSIPTPAQAGLADDDTTWVGGGYVSIDAGARPPGPADTSAGARREREDSLVRHYEHRADSLRTEAAKARADGDTARARQLTARASRNISLARRITRHREGCVNDSTYYAGTASRFGGALRMGVRLPCDESRLTMSPDLPGSIYDPNEQVFGADDRDRLLNALDFSLQPAWAPQKPVLHAGLDLLRYNRIEGLSLGGSATSALGLGYTARAVARIGTADWVPNAELSLARSNGRAELRLGVFHRLGVANDDFGAPLSLGASLSNVLYAHDEGFYYRAWGAELSGTRALPGFLGRAPFVWRAFAERQRTAGREPNTQASLANVFGNATFARNIDAAPLTALGAGGELAHSFGADPLGLRLDARLRAEGAYTHRGDSSGTAGYGRFVADGTLSRSLGRMSVALTGAAGTSAGDLPVQRGFFVGGLQTVRGQFARPEGEGYAGDAFWLARTELGLGSLALRPAVFYDLGWAGPRADFAHPGRPLSGAGAGLSLLDGMIRVDVARGIFPEKRWRGDLSFQTRF